MAVLSWVYGFMKGARAPPVRRGKNHWSEPSAQGLFANAKLVCTEILII